MDVGSRKLLLLILLLNITVSVSGIQHMKVSCHPEKICALRESSVTLTCSYSNIIIITGFWFSLKDKAKWRKEEHPEDLALDSDYAGRVSYTEMTNFRSTLTITDLRERDSGEYRLVFITDKGEKYLSSAGVTLTVTDLQVTHNSLQQTLTCRTSCTLTFTVHRYFWYKNGQYLEKYKDNVRTFPLSKAEEGSYSCSVEGYGSILSLPVCVGRSCYSVTYRDKRVCAVEGSSVEFAGSYSHPSDLSVSEVFWHYFQRGKVFQDLKQETQFTNRVEYVKQDKSSTLKMKNLTKKDSGEYRLRFLIDGEGFSGRPGVVLSVTDLQVRVSRSAVASEGQTTVTLSCITSCTLSNNPTYMWYKNGQPVTDKLTKHNKLYLISSEDAGNYSCAVRGREDLRSPELTVTWSENYTVLKVIMVGLAVFLAVTLLSGALWMWKRKSSSANGHSSTGESGQRHSPAVYENVSASDRSGRVASDDQDDVHYASVVFKNSHTQEMSPSPRRPPDTTEDEDVQYAAVNVSRSTAAIQLVADEAADDPSQLYSKIQKLPTSAV
ncbi:sialoadhesin-like isoform X2 [Ictalurus punctatus]|uniref:Sialoadhesin-like isoform X2 n=1 Tax=Ictalurus punctatus TaxID=7998 RepID=A0A9F7R027_ICTPU|nr:sialoadhesin-like isoform X2 [Ictalurus punctatus]